MGEYAILLLTFVSSIIGGVAVVATQSLLTRRDDAEKRVIEARNQAYADYLRGVAEVALHSGSPSGMATVADARARIAVYGSGNVIDVMSQFVRTGSETSSDAGRSAFLRIVRAMRSDTRPCLADVVDTSMALALFGLTPETIGKNKEA